MSINSPTDEFNPDSKKTNATAFFVRCIRFWRKEINRGYIIATVIKRIGEKI